MKKVLK